MRLVRQFSDREDILDRLERFDIEDLHDFVKELIKVIPLRDENEFEDILNGEHPTFPWLPKAKYFKPIDAIRKSLVDVKLMAHEGASSQLVRLCYIQVITALEAYLGDLLKENALSSQSAIRNLLKNAKGLREEKMTLHDAFVSPNYPKDKAEEYLSKIIYHNFEKIIKLYDLSLGANIWFPTDECKEVLLKAKDIRHDLVHRNGFSKSGEKIRISASDVILLTENVEAWIDKIESEVHV
jgi:hypothetical protein